MNAQRRFSIKAGWLAALLLGGSLIAGCSAGSEAVFTGASPASVSPTPLAYEPALAESRSSERRSEAGAAAEQQAQSQEIYLNDVYTGWKIEAGNDGAGSVGNTLYRTEDGGTKWEKVGDSTTGSFPSGAVEAVRFADERRGWVAVEAPQQGDPGLYETSDGGLTWKKAELKIPADFRTAWFEPKSPILFEGTERGLYIAQAFYEGDNPEANPLLFYVTSDGGTSWSDPVRSEQGELNGLRWETKSLADGTGRSWSITIDGRTWTFKRSDG